MVDKIVITAILAGMAVIAMNTGAQAENKLEKAVFAGGCFWCMEHPYEKLDGVKEVISGYTGGQKENPTYKEVSAGTTGHAEAVEITYDPSKVSYEELLEVFWRQIDPTDAGGQFADRGSQYRTGIFYFTEGQKALAEKSREELAKSGRFSKPLVTEILPAGKFYRAEDYHQDYYRKNPVRYKIYRYGSGRDKFLNKMWGSEKESHKPRGASKRYVKPSDVELKERLAPLQYKVTQRDGTEPAFKNE